MPTNSKEINLIKRLCILNFLELQEIRKRLNIAPQLDFDYPNSVAGYLKELDNKMRFLAKDHSHLWSAPPAAKKGRTQILRRARRNHGRGRARGTGL